MLLGHTLVIITLWLVAITLSTPTNITSGWATFYDDEHCSVNPGIAVSMTNPGCLNESGRRSFHMRKTDHRQYWLIVSPTQNCPCQSYCRTLYNRRDGPCVKLEGDTIGLSYRFLADEYRICNPNNC